MKKPWHRRWDAWFFLVLGVGFLAAAPIGREPVTGVILGVLNLINAAIRFLGIPERRQDRRRERLEAKYAGRPIPPRPDEVPRWFSPDNPPGWYLNPVSDEPAYWSEIGWRRPTSP